MRSLIELLVRWSELYRDDGYAFVIGPIQACGAAEKMGGIADEPAVSDAEGCVPDPVFIRDRVPGGVHCRRQGRGVAAPQDGR